MRMYDIIEKKRLARELSREEIYFMINGFVKGDIPDYQVSAFLMAALLNGMNERETLDLTNAMLDSGDTVDLSEFGELTADKHSTGGVGDKTTLVLIPIVASCGVICAKMSGRGLGHTGGTVDKLETISGYRSSLTSDEFLSQVRDVGVAVTAQSGNLVPADKKLYALRDVTATVDSIPLIASSIMSKKLASGAHSIVLDVKCGSGAFMKDPESARQLARAMVDIGHGAGRNTSAYITNMDRVLGNAVGNSIEVAEAISVLRGEGPDDVRELCLALASSMISMVQKVETSEAEKIARDALVSGRALDKLLEWVHAQGAVSFDPDSYCKDSTKAKYVREIKAESDGYIASCDCEAVGKCACLLGAGRTSKEDVIDPNAGLFALKKTGERISRGDTLAILLTNDESALDPAEKLYRDAHTVTEEVSVPSELILGREE